MQQTASRSLHNAARFLGTAALVGLTSTATLAQGSDDCASAQPVMGPGTYAFDTSSATSNTAACSMDGDVWFLWTATSDNEHSISSCSLTSVDTQIAVYGGGDCGVSSLLACNDDDCGFQSTVNFIAVEGQSYLIQVGSALGAAGGTGSIEVTQTQNSGNCAAPATGADVIVGDVSGCSTYGAVGGMSAYSLGTTSCNTGTAELLWIASNNQHPVIGQNIYRLNDGRFEQVGQSWLKHGFTALQGGLCCSCNSSGTGSRLGVGCSDPYGSGLNGSQSGLGPRSQVNAYTGAFQYPFGSQGQSGDSVYKRAQVPTSDVNPANFPNATYYGEGQYVAPDDAAAGNGFNNVSWRPLSRSGSTVGGSYRLSTTSVTRREQPAIYAWKEADPTVDIQIVNLPNEGRLYVASNCYVDTALGAYRYEYVVFNMNSDRSVNRFEVPVGAGATISGIGMSFPHSHSGEPYDNSAWTSTNNGSTIVWETDDFATNSNANAIRWGTMYSFWFISGNAPEVKQAELGLFKPGPQMDPVTTVCGPVSGMGQPIITSYCDPAANSTGADGVIGIQNLDLNARTMELTGANLPTNAFAYSLASTTMDYVQNAGGSTGHLCVGGNIGRAIGGSILNTGATGTLLETVDLDSIPQPMGSVAVQAGESWHFQYWHRDVIIGLGLSTSNFTDGIRIIFP